MSVEGKGKEGFWGSLFSLDDRDKKCKGVSAISNFTDGPSELRKV